MPWQLVVDGPAPGAENMAKDQWLMESVRRGGAPTLRLYEWSPACLSLGRNQPSGHIDSDALGTAGVDLVRRVTGGRAVLHDREITYSVVVAARGLGAPRAAYARINTVLRDALRGVGIAVELAGPRGTAAPPPSSAPCFAEPLPGELLLDGRKLVGSAQIHLDGVLLQHGSILLEPSPALGEVERAVGGEVEGICAYVRPGPDFRQRLAELLTEQWEQRIGPLRPSPPDRPRKGELDAQLATFVDPSWTFRR